MTRVAGRECGVAPLKHQGLTTDPVDKAIYILNRQFESVFSKPQPLSLKQLAKQAIAEHICTQDANDRYINRRGG